MKERPFQRVIRLVFLMSTLALAGCPAEATDEAGVFVPNMEGTYDRLSVTTFCGDLGNFDPVTETIQSAGNFTLHAQSAGFEDYTGTVDKDGVITLVGAGTECTGNFVRDILTAVCNVTVQSCGIDPDTGAETCEEEEFSCAVSYQRR